MKVHQSKKLLDGFTVNFRQWKANTTHCSYLHGYDIEFLLTFEGDLDERNWVWDFGGMKRAKYMIDGKNPKAWFDFMFDHTTLIAADDPLLHHFQVLNDLKAIQLRILTAVGCEKLAEYVYLTMQGFLALETNGRVKIVSVECKENHRNSAIYSERPDVNSITVSDSNQLSIAEEGTKTLLHD